MKTLIVNNCVNECSQLSLLLTQRGYNQLFKASNSEEAMNTIILEKIDILIVDVVLPSREGIELCKKVRRMNKGKDLIIIATIFPDAEELIQEIFIAGANDFIRKPISSNELTARIKLAKNTYLEKKQREKYELQFEEDLLLAKNFQRSVLSPDIVNKEVTMRAYYDSCANVGGDMYSWYKINDHQYGVMIYNVMGHGIAASLVNMSIYSLVRGIVMRLKKPELVMKEFNRQVYFLLQLGNSMDIYYITVTYLLIDRKKNTISYVNAGHPMGFVFYSPDDIYRMLPTGPFVGVVRAIPFEIIEVELKENCHIILYTDGLKDYLNITFEQLELMFKESLIYRKDSFLKTFVSRNDLLAREKKDDICLLSLLLK